jgi:hypothetical protein
MVARRFAERMVDDAGQVIPVTDLVDAIAELESRFADDNVLGLIHVAPYLLAHLVSHVLVARSDIGWTTAAGRSLVVDGGYTKVLGTNLVGTSALFGWRGQVALRDGPDPYGNRHVAVAERACIIGYERCVGMVQVSAGVGVTRPFTRKHPADLSPRERLLAEVCVHESAHAIAGVLYGEGWRARR